MKKISTFLVVVFFVVLLSLALLTGCDTLKKATEYTVNFEVFDGKVAVDSQQVIKMTKATMPTVSANALPPYATIDGYTFNGIPWDFDTPITNNMTLVANVVFDFSSVLNVDETGSTSYVIQSAKDVFDDTYLYIPGKIGNKTVTVSQEAFLGCASLKKIEFAKGVAINHTAFKACANLEEVILPESMTKIDKNVFNNCNKLKTVVFPESLTTIDEGAFFDTAIESLSLNKVQYIYKDAFKNCTKLEEIKLPKISDLGQEAFAGCTSLKKFDNDVTKIGDGVFRNCTSLEEVNIRKVRNGVTDYCFENATSLHTVSLNVTNPSTSYKIGKRAFAGCTSLRDIDTSKVINIAEEGFQDCVLLTQLDLSITQTIGKKAFCISDDNTALLPNELKITFADPTITANFKLKGIGEMAFYNRTNFKGNGGLLEVNISSGKLKTCGMGAFFNTGINNIICYTTSTTSPPKLPTDFAENWNMKAAGGEINYSIVKI